MISAFNPQAEADMNRVIITAISALSIAQIQGLLMTKNAVTSCLGEEVVFTCTVAEGSSLSWRLLVTRDSNIPALTHTFFYHYYETQRGRTTWSRPTLFHVELKLVSIDPVLVSTLTANLTNIIIDAKVTCQQSFPVIEVQSGHFSLASIPSIPAQITDVFYEYGCTNFNMTLSWIPPHGDHQINYYQLKIDGQSQAALNGTSYMIDSLPYFENITVEVNIVNCAGEGAELNFIVAKGGCFDLESLIGNSIENLCIKPVGYQTVITECEPGEFPEEIISTCQGNGSWTSDPTECSVGCLIPSFPHNITATVTNYDIHDHANVSTNYTAMGSEIQLFCGNQTNGESASPVFTSVCGENGTWSPDLSSLIKCKTDQDSSDTQPQRHFIMLIITGASTGCGMVLLFTIMCGLLCIIRKLCKKQRHNFPEQIDSFYLDSEFQHKLGELNQDTNIPQYETISPLYEIIPENLHHDSETYLRMMNNNAYCKGAKGIL